MPTLEERVDSLELKIDALLRINQLTERVSVDGTEKMVVSVPNGSGGFVERKMNPNLFFKGNFFLKTANYELVDSDKGGKFLFEGNGLGLNLPLDLGWSNGDSVEVINYGFNFNITHHASVVVKQPAPFVNVANSYFLITKTDSNEFSVVQIAKPSTGGGIQNGTISGIQHITGLTYNVWCSKAYINGIEYDVNLSQLITLSNGDATNPRFDVICIEVTDPIAETFQFTIIEGTPAVSPVKPTVDPETQSEISFRLVLASETFDPNAVKEAIYDENLGESDEWTNTFLLTDGNLDATGTPFNGTKYIEAIDGTTPIDPRIVFDNNSEIPLNADEDFAFALRTNGLGSWDYYSSVRIKLINITSGNYYVINLNRNNIINYGFFTDVEDFQLVSIPLSDFFAINPEPDFAFDRVEFTFEILSYVDIDWINILGGNPPITDLGVVYEEKVIGTKLIRTNVGSGFSNVIFDWNKITLWYDTMTSNATFKDINLPLEGVKMKTQFLTGAFTPTFPSYWQKKPSSHDYDGSVWNEITIQCIDGTPGSEIVWYTIENLS